MRYAILSDIHANLTALEAVYGDICKKEIDGIILLGDIIDNGVRPNEVVDFLKNKVKIPICVNLWGNHERAILRNDFNYFSTERGVESAKWTAKNLSQQSKEYLNTLNQDAKQEFSFGGMNCLAVHGSMEDPYWKSIFPDNVNGEYQKYSIVFSGHSHYSQVFSKFYQSEDKAYRNKKKVIFINPGSVGQPRNHDENAQYAIVDIGEKDDNNDGDLPLQKNAFIREVSLYKVPYDIKKEQQYFENQVDSFYKERLTRGI